MLYTTLVLFFLFHIWLFYQDFKDTFVCYTQLITKERTLQVVVLSGFQRYFCMLYTTLQYISTRADLLFYQDFKDTFVCYTQLLGSLFSSISVVLSGFQRYFCMLYTTGVLGGRTELLLFYQDFKDTFVCYTQR